MQSSPRVDERLSPSRAGTIDKLLFICGILSSLVYVTANVVAAQQWNGYSFAAHTISELSAIDAPSRSTYLPFGIAYDLLLLAFGIGLWRAAAARRGLRIAAGSLIAIAVLGSFWPPMHMRGVPPTLTDTLHVVFASVVSVLTILAMVSASGASGRWFRVFSIAMLVVVLGFGTLTFLQAPQLAANEPTPWIGLTERIDLGAYLLWVVGLAVAHLRGAIPTAAQPRRTSATTSAA